MTADELVKAVALAIIHAHGSPAAQARAAIRAVYAAMREPSDAMNEAGGYAAGTFQAECWRAMLAAHPIAEVARDE